MTMSRLAALLGLIGSLLASSVNAQYIDGRTLEEWAQEFQRVRSGTGDYLSHIYHRRFQVYILGVHDAYASNPDAFPEDRQFCRPSNASVNQVSMVVYRYLQENRGLPDEPASVLVMNALIEAFPCGSG